MLGEIYVNSVPELYLTISHFAKLNEVDAL